MARDNNRSEFGRWLAQAKFDLSAARQSTKSDSHEWACFQAQQAGEKALKAFLLLHGKREMLTHSIYELIGMAAKIDRRANELAPTRRLDYYYITTRYPGGMPAGLPHEFFKKEDAEECIRYASAILRWVEAHAPK